MRYVTTKITSNVGSKGFYSQHVNVQHTPSQPLQINSTSLSINIHTLTYKFVTLCASYICNQHLTCALNINLLNLSSPRFYMLGLGLKLLILLRVSIIINPYCKCTIVQLTQTNTYLSFMLFVLIQPLPRVNALPHPLTTQSRKQKIELL